jgi:putative ABC transport system permease protein
MLRNYLVVALRALRRQPGYAAINVFGLGVGMAACLLIGLFVWQERTYDRFHDKADRVSRVWVVEEYGEEGGAREFISTATPVVLGPTVEAEFPEVEAVIRVQETSTVVGPEGSRFEEPIHAVDPRFFEVFSFRLLAGDPATALAAPRQVVLTLEAAERYFPGQDPIGRTLPMDAEMVSQDYLVTGIVEAPPVASSLQFRFLIPFVDWEAIVGESTRTSWFNVTVSTYLLTREGVDRAALEALFPRLMERVLPAGFPGSYVLRLQPLTDVRLGTTLPDRVAPVRYRQYLGLLGIIAAFVLAVAAINFVTLSVGQSARRAREVGLRKALGAQRTQLAGQFWGEALVLAGLGLGLGVALAALYAPAFGELAGVPLAFGMSVRVGFLLLALLAVVGLGAGAYPALVLSGFRPVEALRDRLQLTGDRSLLRRGLVVVQFSLAILLVIGTLMVGRQLDYVRSLPLGFERAHTVVIPTGLPAGPAQDVLERFRQRVGGHAAVEEVTLSAFTLSEPWGWAGYEDPEGTWRTFRLNWGSPDFLAFSGVPLAAGRFHDAAFALDSSRVVVNEAFVRDLGWASAEDAVGRVLPLPGEARFEVVGVVRDFHFASLREAVEPMVYALAPSPVIQATSDFSTGASSLRKLHVRIRDGDTPATLAALRQGWEAAAPDLPYDYYFLDEAVDARYRQEEQLGRIATTASLLALFIAALGLFALATLSVARRRKEVGVRKVLGASTAGLVALLSKDFLKLVGLAFVVAAPLGYVVTSRWLEGFAYRASPGLWVFLLAGVLAAGIALAAVSYHAFRAATADPVRALRSE